ncbi:hypothetical protein IJT93_10885 [bacterium]|nr:hypothetical protein [bacterium]
MSWLSIILLSLLGLILLFIFILLPLYIYFIKNIIKNVNRSFTEMVREGNLGEARQLFEKTVGAIPSALEFNPLLIEAAVDLKNVDSPQKKEQLQIFFSELAEIYLKESPDSGFVKMFAAGLKGEDRFRLQATIEKALDADSSPSAYNFAAMLMQNKDILLAIQYSIEAMHQLLSHKRLNSQTFISAMRLIIDNMFKAGLYKTALQCCQLCLSHRSLNTETQYFFKAVKWRISDLLGYGVMPESELTALDETQDVHISLLPLYVYYALRANNARLALSCVQRLKENSRFKLPKWCMELFLDQINIISFLQSSVKTPDSRRTAAVPDYLIKNLKEAADTYSDNKTVQIIAADALYCAGSYIQALMYLQRSRKLRSELLLAENSEFDIEKISRSCSAYLLSLPENLPYLSGYGGEDELMFYLLMKLNKEEDALQLAANRCKSVSEDSPEGMLWQLRKLQLQQNGECAVENDLKIIDKRLTEYRSGHHIDESEIPSSQYDSENSDETNDSIEKAMKEDCFIGELQYYYALAEYIKLQNKPDSDEQRLEVFSNLFESCPGSNLLIRTAVPLAVKLGRQSLLLRLSEALQARAVSMEDIETLRLADEALNAAGVSDEAAPVSSPASASGAPAAGESLNSFIQSIDGKTPVSETDLLKLLTVSEVNAEKAALALEECGQD